MLFSLEWLLRLCPVQAAPEKIAELLTSRGLTVDALSGEGDDAVLEVDVPANRPDCLGHLGLARELSAATSTPLAPRDGATPAQGDAVDTLVEVDIDDPELCPRYTAGWVRGVKVGPSPKWVVDRLERCGLRSVNNVVDASNLVLLELSHPIHFFDGAKVKPRQGGSLPWIGVRRARTGEKLRTLDGIDRNLDPETLVITDGGGPVALAGVIGGGDSEITETTTDVLIEAAQFQTLSIRATARRIGVQTDASYRFERGVDREGLVEAQSLAGRLLVELAGGTPAPGLVDAYPSPHVPRRATLRESEIDRLLGFTPPSTVIEGALTALSLQPESSGDGTFAVTVPSYRLDLDNEADLVEEVARHVGYDEIPTPPPEMPTGGREPHEREQADVTREVVARLGFHEAVGYAMIGVGEDDPFVEPAGPVPMPLSNPIAEPLSLLRRSVLPGLPRAADRNLRRGTRDVRLFEVGRVFLRAETAKFPEEPLRLGLAWSGSARPRHWGEADRDLDLYDIIGIVEHIVQSLAPERKTGRAPGARPGFHPGRSASWSDRQRGEFAWAGALHPDLQEKYSQTVFLAEIDLTTLRCRPTVRQHRSLPRVPAVTRDLSLLLSPEHRYADVLATLEAVEAPAPAFFEVIDRYAGKGLAEGEASVTVRSTLQPMDRTLTDQETENYRVCLVQALAKRLGIKLRA